MAPDLEKRTQDEFEKLPPQAKTETTPQNPKSLESKVGFKQAVKDLTPMDWVKIGGTGAAAAALTGGGSILSGIANAATTMGSYMGAEYLVKRKFKEKMSSDDIKNNGLLGAYMTPITYAAFKGLDYITNPLAKTAVGLGAAVPLFQTVFWPARHIINNYSPSKLYKRIFKKEEGQGSLTSEIYNEALKPNFWDAWKKVALYMGLPLHVIWNKVPMAGQLPAAAGSRTAIKYLLESASRKNKPEYTPALNPA